MKHAHSPPPAHHVRMLEQCVAAGYIKRVGDSYEITPDGHAYTVAQSLKLHGVTLESKAS